MANGDGIVWDDDGIQWDDAPSRLRAGTGHFGKDILQDLANIGLPEQYAAPLIQALNEGSTIEPDGEGGYILVRADGSRRELNRSGVNILDEYQIPEALTANLDYESMRDGRGNSAMQPVDVQLPLGEDALKIYSALVQGKAGVEVGKKVAPQISAKIAKWAKDNMAMSGAAASGLFSLWEQGLGEVATAPLPGKNPDFSMQDAGMMTLFGAAPGVAMATGRRAGNFLSDITGIQGFSNPIERVRSALELRNTPDGELTPRAKESLEAAGFRTDILTPDEIKLANQSVARNVRLASAPRGTQAGFDMADIDATEGMIFQNPEVIKTEVASPARAQAINTLHSQGKEVAQPSSLESVREDVLALHKREYDVANQAFDAARATGDVPVRGQRLADVRQSMDQELRAVYGEDRDLVDEVMGSFPEFKKGRGSSGLVDARGSAIFGSGADKEVNISRLFEWRRDQLSKLPGREAKKVFESEMDRLIESDLSNALEKEAVDVWRKANSGYRDFSIKWDSNDLISKLVAKDSQGAGLRYSPEKTANLLFNVSDAGITNKEGVFKSIRFLRGMRDSGELSQEAWNSLQGEAMHRLLRFDNNFKQIQNRILDGGKGQRMVKVNGQNMASAWEAAKTSIPKELDELFGPEVVKRMDNFIERAVLMDTKIETPTQNKIDPISKLLVRIGRGLGNATFTMKRMLSREGAASVQRTAEVRAAEALHGPFFASQGSNYPRAATAEALAIGNEDWWEEQFDQILLDIKSGNWWEDETTGTP